jgi:hypothetical protein
MFGKVLKTLIKEKSGLDDEADVAEQLIPSTFEEETNFLSTDSIETLRMHYCTEVLSGLQQMRIIVTNEYHLSQMSTK